MSIGQRVWLLVGLGAQAGFYLQIPVLMWFCIVGASGTGGGWWADAMVIDVLLLLGFCVPHSLLLIPRVRGVIARGVPPAVVPSLFTWSAVLGLGLLMACWKPWGPVIWECDGLGVTLMLLAAAGAWFLLGWGMSAAGFGWQTGWTPLRAWWKGRPAPPRTLVTTGIQAWIRHPIYLGFALASWTTLRMDASHLLLSCAFSAYCLAGSIAKDRRLLRLVGRPYAEYAARIPGWPLLPGPLGRLPNAIAKNVLPPTTAPNAS